jgi:hypothetical protein
MEPLPDNDAEDILGRKHRVASWFRKILLFVYNAGLSTPKFESIHIAHPPNSGCEACVSEQLEIVFAVIEYSVTLHF